MYSWSCFKMIFRNKLLKIFIVSFVIFFSISFVSASETTNKSYAQVTEAVESIFNRVATYLEEKMNYFVEGVVPSSSMVSDNESLRTEKEKFDFIRKDDAGDLESGYLRIQDKPPVIQRETTLSTQTKTVTSPTETIIERIVYYNQPIISSFGFYTKEELDNFFKNYNQEIRSELLSRINNLSSVTNSQYAANTTAIALTNKIDQLNGTSLTNITVNGVSGLTDADIPDNILLSGYLPITGGNLTGNLGIGTTSPYAPLSVNGQAVASYFTTSSSTATSTLAYGMNLLGGCFAINGVCITGGGASDGTWSTTSANYWETTQAARSGVSNWATTSTDYWKTENNFFSTTSTDHWYSSADRFSTTSVNALLATIDKGYFFSTTSTDYWKTENNFFSTTSAEYFASTGSSWSTTSASYFLSQNQGNAFSSTSADAWYISADRFSTTTNDAWLTTIDKGYFFSTTSSAYFLSQNQGAAFSSTSVAYYLAENQDSLFSTTSANYWKTENNFFSTTSAEYFASTGSSWSTTSASYFLSQNQGNAFSSTSADAWYISADRFSTTTNDAWLTTIDKGYFFSTTSSAYFLSQNQGAAFSSTSVAYYLAENQDSLFSTTSANYWKTENNFFSTTSADHWYSSADRFSTTSINALLATINKEYFFSTTSSDYWKTQNNFFSTTSAEYFASTGSSWSTTSANYYVNSSTTIPKTYTANTFTSLNTFANATTTQFSVTGNAWLGTFTGPLQAVNGLVSATNTISAIYGGTGLSSYNTGQLLYADTPSTLAGLNVGGNDTYLKVSGGVLTWATVPTGSGGSGVSPWATSTDNLSVYLVDPADVVIIGGSATTTNGNIFEVVGNTKIGGNLLITGNSSLGTITSGIWNGTAIGDSYIVKTGDWTGTFDGQEGSYYLDAGNLTNFSTPADYWYASADRFSTTSVSYLLGSLDKGYFFSTTSANYWKSENNFFSSTSADYWYGSADRFSTTSVDAWYASVDRFSTTSVNALLATIDKGYFFSTTSTDYWKTVNNFFSTTSANYYINSSTTIPKTYTNNTFTGGNIFGTVTTTEICFATGECMESPNMEGSALSFYPTNTASEIGTYEQMLSAPTGGLFVDESCVADSDIAGGYCDIDTYISTSTDITITNYPAGTTRIHAYTYVDSSVGTSYLVLDGYRREVAGNEYWLGQATTTEINQTTIQESLAAFTGTSDTAFNVDGTDRLVMKVRGYTTSNVAKTIHWTYQSSAYYSHIETPITIADRGYANKTKDETILGDWTFSGLTSFANSTSTLGTIDTFWSTLANFTNATATQFSVTGDTWLGTFTGPLQAINGLVSATSTISVAYGGTGLSSAPTLGQLLIGNGSQGYTLLATSTLGINTSDIVEGSKLFYTDERVNTYVDASTTIPKAYSVNNFTALNTFTNATATQFSVTGDIWLGTLTGPLQAINGLVSATSTMSVAYGGTGLSSAPTLGQLLIGNDSGGYTLLATSTLGINTSDIVEGSKLFYTDERVNTYVDASTTIPKAYSVNNFTALNTFTNATATQFSVTGDIWLGTLTGPLQAINGLVSATSTMSVAYGGTGLSSAPTFGQMLVGNSDGGYTLTSTSSLGLAAGSIGQLQFNDGSNTFAADANLFWDNIDKFFGIGTSTPEARLHVSDSLSPLAIFDSIDSTNDAQILTRRGNGTPTSPSAVISGQSIGFYGFNGYGTTGFGLNPTAYMRGIAAENFTDSAKGTHLAFGTASSTTASAVERMRITDMGLVGIGTTSPLRNIDVKGTWGGNSIISAQTLTTDSTVTISTAGVAYYLENNSGTTDSSTATIFNLTGLPDIEGTHAFVEMRAAKGVTANERTQSVSLKVNGSLVNNAIVSTASTTLAESQIKSFNLLRLNSQWKMVGAAGDGTGANIAANVVKTVPYDLTTNATVAQNTNLSVIVGANETWSINAIIRSYNSASADDVKFYITAPSGAICYISTSVVKSNSTFTGNSCGVGLLTTLTTIQDVVTLGATVVNGATPGTIVIQYSANTGAGLAHFDAGSFMFANRNLGSDLAEMYYTRDDSMGPAMVVSIDDFTDAGVKQSDIAYDKNILGVITTQPGMILGSAMIPEGTRPIYVALSGRVPVKVTTENGKIRAGDYITSSSIPGVAMKAIKSGPVIGQALSDFDGDGIGMVTLFIKNGIYTGTSLASLFGDLFDKNISEFEYQKAILEKLVAQSTTTPGVSEIYTDRVATRLGITAPTVVTKDLFADTITANKIVGLEFITDKISSLSSDVVKVASSSASISDILGKIETSNIKTLDLAVLNSLSVGSSLTILGESIFDGVSTFFATTTMSKLVVENIDSPQILALSDGLTLVGNNLATLSASVADNESILDTYASTTSDILNRLSSLENKPTLDLSSVLSLDSGLIINSLTIMNGGLKVDQIGSLGGQIVFSDDVEFIGRPYVNSDTAGFAKIFKGAKSVRINFDREYLSQPVINTTITFDENSALDVDNLFNSNVQYVVTERTVNGFTILLSREAGADMTFSWFALAVKNSKTFRSEEINLPLIPNVLPTLIEADPSSQYFENNTTTEPVVSSEVDNLDSTTTSANQNVFIPVSEEVNTNESTVSEEVDNLDSTTTSANPNVSIPLSEEVNINESTVLEEVAIESIDYLEPTSSNLPIITIEEVPVVGVE